MWSSERRDTRPCDVCCVSVHTLTCSVLFMNQRTWSNPVGADKTQHIWAMQSCNQQHTGRGHSVELSEEPLVQAPEDGHLPYVCLERPLVAYWIHFTHMTVQKHECWTFPERPTLLYCHCNYVADLTVFGIHVDLFNWLIKGWRVYILNTVGTLDKEFKTCQFSRVHTRSSTHWTTASLTWVFREASASHLPQWKIVALHRKSWGALVCRRLWGRKRGSSARR